MTVDDHHAAARRNRCGGQDPRLVQVGRRRDQGRRQSVRGRDGQGHDRSAGDRRGPPVRNPRRARARPPRSAKWSRSSADGAAKAPAPAEAPAAKAAPWRSPFEEVSTPTDKFGPAKGPNGVRITPLARRLIAQHGLDLAGLATEAERRGAKKIDGGGRARGDLDASGCARAVAGARLRRRRRLRRCPFRKATSSR